MPECIFTASWDDGSAGDMRAAGLFARRSLPCTWYVPCGPPGSVMAPSRLRELSAAFEIGSHTLTHRRVTTLPDAEARDEIVRSKAVLEDLCSRPVRMFCFPGGEFRRRHLDMAASAGYLGLRTCELLSFDTPRPRGAIYIMPTTFQVYPRLFYNYLANIATRGAVRNVPNLPPVLGSRDVVASAEALIEWWLRRGGVFHLWGHTHDMEAHCLWKPLDTVLSMVASVARHVRLCANSEVVESCFARPHRPAPTQHRFRFRETP